MGLPMSDTPRTDAVENDCLMDVFKWSKMLAHARQLERENARLREALQSIINGDTNATWAGSQCVEIAQAALKDANG